MLWIYLMIAFTVALIFAFGLCRAASRVGPSQPVKSRSPSSALPPVRSSVKSSYGPGGDYVMQTMQRCHVRGEIYFRWGSPGGLRMPFVREQG